MTFSFHARDAGSVHLCGHRGHMTGAPENTLAAFRAAHDHGATTCEIDTVLTRDGQIVVLHDLLLDRTTTGTGPVKDMDMASIATLDAGSWFSPDFAGEPVPSLAKTLEATRPLGMGLEIEVKEKLKLNGYVEALKQILTDPADLDRVMLISFDHAHLKALKAAMPGIRTGGIAHERYGDPLSVMRSADLDQLCIDLAVFNKDDARRLKDAGHSIRCHAYKPEVMEKAHTAGLGWHDLLAEGLEEGLIDTLSGDDVAWLAAFKAEKKHAQWSGKL